MEGVLWDARYGYKEYLDREDRKVKIAGAEGSIGLPLSSSLGTEVIEIYMIPLSD
jgi:hypothetical protein